MLVNMLAIAIFLLTILVGAWVLVYGYAAYEERKWNRAHPDDPRRYRAGIWKRRFHWIGPWATTRWGFLSQTMWPRRGCDEYHNKSIYLIVPLLGEFCVFYERDLNDTIHLYGMIGDEPQGPIFPDCDICVEMLQEFEED